MSDQTLQSGYMAVAARAAEEKYRARSGVVLLLEAATGIALLVAPLGVSRLLGLADDVGIMWARVAGLMLLMLVAHLAVGLAKPALAKATNILGFFGRGVMALLLLAHGGSFIIVGLINLATAVFLAFSYFSYFKAEVMNRP